MQERNMHLHELHLAHQQQGDKGSLHNDYAEHAVVEDSMFRPHSSAERRSWLENVLGWPQSPICRFR